MAAFTCSK